MNKFTDFVAIDPLALILPSHVYVNIVEKLHPHVPKVADIREAAKSLTPDERAFVQARAKVLAAHAQAVVEALG